MLQVLPYIMLRHVVYQVAEPLRAMVMGAPLEDARHLAQRYDRMRQEAEAQVLLLLVMCVLSFLLLLFRWMSLTSCYFYVVEPR